MDINRIIKSLQKSQDLRTEQDIKFIHSYFSQQNWFRELRNNEIEDLCLRGRYEKHNIGSVIYRKEDAVKSWYVLMSGNVIIGTLLFSSSACFGKMSSTSKRTDDCIVLDPSEIVVVDCNDDHKNSNYPKPHPVGRSRSFSGNASHISNQHEDFDTNFEKRMYESRHAQENEEHSRESDSMSILSARGSDTLTSSVGDHGVDLTGLLESTVDSEGEEDSDDEISGHIKKKIVSDAVLEALEKEEKSDRDIKLILDLVQHLPAFNNMTSNVRKALCSVMRYAQIEEANRVLISSGAQLDTWVVILNGMVEVEEADEINILQTGDWFGVKPTRDKQLNTQIIKTKTGKCQFVLVPQDDYCRIINESAENIIKVYEGREVVLVLEKRKVGDEERKVVIRGEPNHLLQELFNKSQDPTYVQDFLLTYRTFFKYPAQVAYKIVEYLEIPSHRDKVVSIFLDWMNWYYRDFENNIEMRTFLEHLEKRLEDLRMFNELDLLTSKCALLSKPREVVLNKKSRDENLHFELVGDPRRASSIFVGSVEEGSRAHEAGLGRGDQILDVNTRSFKNITLQEANAFLSSATHLSITVKYNMHDYKQRQRKSIKNSVSHTKNQNQFKMKAFHHDSTTLPFNLEDPKKPPIFGKIKNKILRAFPANPLVQISSNSDLHDNGKSQSLMFGKRFGSSHPDLSSLHFNNSNNMASNFVAMNDLNVLKIYKEDQSYRYVFVDKEITAQQVVMLALKEFGLSQTSRDFALYEVTLNSDSCMKQKRFPGNLQNLAEKSTYKSRYYIKHIEGPVNLLPDDSVEEMKKECQLNFLSLNCAEVAAQLTYKDFELFGQISPSEYIDELFKVENVLKKSNANNSSNVSSQNLKQFAKLANTEMFWVVTHICNEQNISNRVKAIKQFIQVAKHCIECKNFNSAFAIISGLGHQSVSRLKQTWEKIPSKSLKLFEDLQTLMDPSRNMSKYRSTINAERPPLIPFYPLVMKDLTFIHLGNDSIIDGLINFEKLRMVAKEVRHISNMAPSPDTINFSSLNSSAMAMMRRKVDDLAILNRKKIFEEAQMVRRVRAYLATYKLVEDESQLAEMSNCCECQDGTAKRFEIPFSASKSAPLSNCVGPKFGTDSPENIKKLVSLSAGSRPLDGSAEELRLSALDEQRAKKIHKKQNSFSQPTNLLSNSQFYVSIDQSNPRQEGSGPRRQRLRNLSKETDSGRYSCSGDDVSNGSTNSNHGSPPTSNKPTKKGFQTNEAFPSRDINNLALSSKSRCEDCTQKFNSSLAIPLHLADNSKKKPQIKKITGNSINIKHDCM